MGVQISSRTPALTSGSSRWRGGPLRLSASFAKFAFEDETRNPVSMEVEDAVTATVDAIARSQGYSPMGDSAAATGAGQMTRTWVSHAP